MATVDDMVLAPSLSTDETVRDTYLAREASLLRPDVCIVATTRRVIVGPRQGSAIPGFEAPLSIRYEDITSLRRRGVRRHTLEIETASSHYRLPSMAAREAAEFTSTIVEEAGLTREESAALSPFNRGLGLLGMIVAAIVGTVGLIVASAGIGLVLTIVGAAIGVPLLLAGGVLAWGASKVGAIGALTGVGTVDTYGTPS